MATSLVAGATRFNLIQTMSNKFYKLDGTAIVCGTVQTAISTQSIGTIAGGSEAIASIGWKAATTRDRAIGLISTTAGKVNNIISALRAFGIIASS